MTRKLAFASPTHGHVFISYASEDLPIANRISQDLEANGHLVWRDRGSLIGGVRWEATIRAAIREADKAMVLVSRHSVAKEGFIQREVRLILQRWHEMPPDREFVIVVRLDDSR